MDRDARRCDIVIAGVGGQGILLASDILGTACIQEGVAVRGTETHGMAQRGGSVEAHVRINCTYGPKVDPGTADVLIAFEPLEAARYAAYLRPHAVAVVNTSAISPVGGGSGCPSLEELLRIVSSSAGRVIAGDFTAEAEQTGSVRSLNVLMLGVASPFLPLRPESLQDAIRKLVKPAFLAVNREAFLRGRRIGSGD